MSAGIVWRAREEPVQPIDAESVRQETLEAYRVLAVPLGAYARRLTADTALAQDAVQETFLRFFLARMQGEDIRNLSAWLHRVMHNYICQCVRSSAVRSCVALEDAPPAALCAAPVTAFAEWEEAVERLLAPRECQCLRLRTEGLDYTEIAARMDISPGTVGALLHRAVRKLRLGFGQQGRSST
jgi:RNA polymerase sigma-70 factor, ECF subfamily